MQSVTPGVNKKKEFILREFARSLNDEDLRFVGSRLYQRYGGDVAEVVEFLQTFNDLDRYLGQAKDANGVYDMVDEIARNIEAEATERDDERRRQYERRESR
jgi:hypothetical protein